jgi:hypothetical protein
MVRKGLLDQPVFAVEVGDHRVPFRVPRVCAQCNRDIGDMLTVGRFDHSSPLGSDHCNRHVDLTFPMPVPPLMTHGLMPVGVYTCTLEEAGTEFCWNERRREIWDGLTRFLGWLSELGLVLPIYLDGSFVTDKPLPGDVDLVLDLTSATAAQQKEALFLFYRQRAAIKTEYDVDFCPNLPGAGANDFGAFFQYVRAAEANQRNVGPDVRKGILRIEQWLDGLNK